MRQEQPVTEAAHPSFDEAEQAIMSQVLAEEGGEMQTASETPETQGEAEKPAAEAPPQANAEAKPAEEKPAADEGQGNIKAALRAARRAEARTKAELERLRQENEQLRKAAPAAQSDQEFTPDELESMKEDFPVQYKLYIKQKELEKQLSEKRHAVAQPEASTEFQPVEFDPAVQELVDQVPDLLAWQHDPQAQEKLKRAIAYDAALEKDPDWMDKPVIERFEEAVARTKRALGSAPAPAAPAATRPDPAAALAAIKPTGPKGISDFGGGAPASAPSLNYARMSDEEILASLPVS
jgi:hypothetical protein